MGITLVPSLLVGAVPFLSCRLLAAEGWDVMAITVWTSTIPLVVAGAAVWLLLPHLILRWALTTRPYPTSYIEADGRVELGSSLAKEVLGVTMVGFGGNLIIPLLFFSIPSALAVASVIAMAAVGRATVQQRAYDLVDKCRFRRRKK